MANIQIATTAREDAAIQAHTTTFNSLGNGAPLTPAQFITKILLDIVDSWADQLDSTQSLTKGQLYNKASAADKAAVDNILAKYVGT